MIGLGIDAFNIGWKCSDHDKRRCPCRDFDETASLVEKRRINLIAERADCARPNIGDDDWLAAYATSGDRSGDVDGCGPDARESTRPTAGEFVKLTANA